MKLSVISFLLIVIGLWNTPGCNREPAAAPTPEPMRVVSTVYAMADIVRQVGGERVIAEWFIESGQSLDELSESPERRNMMRNAALIVTRGAADPWTLEGTGNNYQDHRLLRLDTLPGARDDGSTEYIWLDPGVARELADELAIRLSTLEPRSEDYFKSNATEFIRQVTDRTERTRATINSNSERDFLTLDTGFFPLARRFGLHPVSMRSVPISEPTAYNVKQLKQTASDAGVHAIYANVETPLVLLRDWESRLNMPVLAMDALGSSGSGGRSTYMAILQYNLDQLVKGLNATRAATTIKAN